MFSLIEKASLSDIILPVWWLFDMHVSDFIPFCLILTKTCILNCFSNCLKIEYKLGRNELNMKTLQVSVWDHDTLGENNLIGAVYIKLRNCELDGDNVQWYNLDRIQITDSSVFAWGNINLWVLENLSCLWNYCYSCRKWYYMSGMSL